MLAANEVLGARLLAANQNDDNGGGDGSNDESKCVEPKPKKLAKSKNSKGKKSAKSKKSSKNRNSPNFSATEPEPSFLTPEARWAFNCLQLAFTKAPIIWHFDLKCYIQIKTDALGYAIGDVLS